jgi:hypothetical protein
MVASAAETLRFAVEFPTKIHGYGFFGRLVTADDKRLNSVPLQVLGGAESHAGAEDHLAIVKRIDQASVRVLTLAVGMLAGSVIVSVATMSCMMGMAVGTDLLAGDFAVFDIEDQPDGAPAEVWRDRGAIV